MGGGGAVVLFAVIPVRLGQLDSPALNEIALERERGERERERERKTERQWDRKRPKNQSLIPLLHQQSRLTPRTPNSLVATYQDFQNGFVSMPDKQAALWLPKNPQTKPLTL